MSKGPQNPPSKAASEKAAKSSGPKRPPVLSGQTKASASVSPESRKAAITAAFNQAFSPENFQWLLEDLGYELGLGDHDNLVVVDLAGNEFNLRTHIKGMVGAELQNYFGDLMGSLPSLDDAKATQKVKRRQVKQTRNVVKRVAFPVNTAKPPKERKSSEKRRLTTVVGTRCNDEELAAVDEAASNANMTRAEYVRRQILEMEPKTRSVRRPGIQVQQLSKLVAQLGKIGSNMNQIARAANMGKTLSGMLEAELAELRELRPRLFKALEREP